MMCPVCDNKSKRVVNDCICSDLCKSFWELFGEKEARYHYRIWKNEQPMWECDIDNNISRSIILSVNDDKVSVFYGEWFSDVDS